MLNKEPKKIKRVCVFSGKRGGFGAFLPLMQLIEKDPELELQVMLVDMHASAKVGNAVEEAKKNCPNSPIELI